MNYLPRFIRFPLAFRFFLSTAILTVVGIILYASAITVPFLYDDGHAIVNNPYIQNLDEYQEIIGIERVFSRSFLLLTYAVNLHIGGSETFGFHLFNTTLHVFSGILLFFLSWELLNYETIELRFRLKRLPLIASLTYVINPLSVESVVYLSSRSALLSTFFYLVATLVFVRWKKDSNSISAISNLFIFPAILIATLFLGFGSKAIIVTMPIMGLVYLCIFHESFNVKKTFISSLPLFACLLIYLGIRQYKTGNIFSLTNDPSFTEKNRLAYLLTQFEVVVYYYALKIFLPINLNFEPDVRLITEFWKTGLLFAIGIIASIWAAVIKLKSKIAQFGVIWFFVTLLPTSTFVPLKQIATEHRMYLPSIGFFLVFGVLWLNTLRFIVVRQFLLITTLCLMTLLTINRNLDFQSAISIWEDVVTKSPHKTLTHNNLANAYLEDEMYDKAEKHLKISLNINPTYRSAYLNLGHIYFKRDDFTQAKKYFDLAIFYGEMNGLVFYNAGVARARLGTLKEAIPFFEKAIAKKPSNSDFHYALANAYKKLKRRDEAIKEYRKTLSLKPSYLFAQNNMGVVFFEKGMYRLAEKLFQKTLRTNINNVDALNNLATLYAKTGRYKLALDSLKKYLALKPLDREKAASVKLLEKLIPPLNE
jgi:tetratricopeptide (TPR) repeat protein